MLKPMSEEPLMQLYYAPETISVAVAVALEEAGLPHERVRVDFAAAEQRGPDYLKINPKGRVPALRTEGTILTETGAILDYIAAKSETPLMPADPLEAAKVRSVMYYLASTMHVNHAHKMRGHRWADKPESHADMAAKVAETMATSARFVEDNCLTGPFILGDTLTIGDCYLFAVCRWLPRDEVDLAPFPKITAFLEAMTARPSVEAIRDAGVIPA
jgi:glutathione S-transferase